MLPSAAPRLEDAQGVGAAPLPGAGGVTGGDWLLVEGDWPSSELGRGGH